MEYTLYLEPQFQSQKSPRKIRLNQGKTILCFYISIYTILYFIFIESSKELRFITEVLEDFSFFFYVFYYIFKLQTDIQGQQVTFRRVGVKTFRKDLAL